MPTTMAAPVWRRRAVAAALALLHVVLLGAHGDGAWSGPALSIGHTAPDGLPVLLADGGPPQPAYWLTLHTYTPSDVFEFQVAKAAQAGMRVICICLTSDDVMSTRPYTDPWLSSTNQLDNRTRAMLVSPLSTVAPLPCGRAPPCASERCGGLRRGRPCWRQLATAAGRRFDDR